ncbi:MAG TPA: hypothetical protein PKI93_06230 [Alphaproteobacteria bacterium]|nr:hypothetical protein [Alphaproteobacteria bacterium]HNS45054.1 hypothetical protein [Alphaproteobacteria bacterium]
MNKHLLIAAVFLVLLCGTAKAESFTYAPDHCDTEVTFPEKPFIENKCLLGDNCTDVVTFTKIAPPDSSLNVRVTCVAYPKEELDTYTPEVAEETLKRLLKDQNMEAYDISSDEQDGFRRSTSMSIGTKDNTPYMYTGQIWIGEQSMFTIEAQMKGPQNEQIGKTFAEILKATHAKNNKSEKEDKKTQAE